MLKKIALTAAMVLAVGGAAHAQGIDPIKTRQVGMSLVSAAFAGVRAVVAANGDVRTLENPGKAIQRWGALIPAMYPAGSDKGETKAAPAVFSDPAGYAKAAMALSTAGEALATAAKAGDAAAVAVAVKSIGDACGACHKDYRLK